MNCPSCQKEVVADKLFCTWCDIFIPKPEAGKKAGLFSRWLASAIDPMIIVLLYIIITFVMVGIGSSIDPSLGIAGFVIVTIGYAGFFFWLLGKGMTPGKWILGEQVIDQKEGTYPGFGKMILREVVGKFVSGLFLGLGYFTAIWDKDNQAWHDKIAGTVVVHKKKQ